MSLTHLVVVVGVTTSKNLRLHHLKSDRNEIW